MANRIATFSQELRTLTAGVPSISKWVDEHSVDDYPYGRFTTSARWYVERKGKRARVSRVTVNPKTERPNKPKTLTYGTAAKIGIGSDGRAYPIIGGPGQITVYEGTFKYLMTLFPKDSMYKTYAKALGIESGPKNVQVKKVPNGAVIDGLQGQKTTIREILEIGGLSKADIAEIDKVTRKNKITHDEWHVTFKDGRKPYVIETKS